MQDKRTPPLPTPLFEVTETGSEWIIPLAGNQSTMTITKAVKDEIGRPYRPGSGRLTIHPPHHGIDVVAFGHWELSTRPVLNDREKQAGWVLVVTVENPYDHTRHSMDFGYQPRASNIGIRRRVSEINKSFRSLRRSLENSGPR